MSAILDSAGRPACRRSALPRVAIALKLGCCMMVSAYAASAYTVGKERSAPALTAMDAMCSSDSACRQSSVMPIPNRTGDAAICVQTLGAHKTYVTGTPQTIYLHQHKNGCSHSVRAYLKIAGVWSSAGTLQPGADEVLEMVHEGGDGPDANVVMFCRSGEPKDDLACR